MSLRQTIINIDPEFDHESSIFHIKDGSKPNSKYHAADHDGTNDSKFHANHDGTNGEISSVL